MNCPVCKNTNLEFLYQSTDGPVMQNELCGSLKNALGQEKVSITLYGCKDCGFVFNADFDSKKTKYSSGYDNTQEHSLYFSKYLMRTVKRLIKKYNLKNKSVAELGCGKGGFLKLLYENGVKKIRGFDPSFSNHNSLIDRLVVKKYFDVKDIKNKVDFIICRHVLEHIPNPAEFIYSVSKCLKNNGVMYFELPSLEWIIKNRAFYDFFYEHCNYFSKSSVLALFNQFGFGEITFNYGLKGQYFKLEINRSPKIKSAKLINFKQIPIFIDEKIKIYKKNINDLNNFAIWGAGAKGITFLNRLNIDRYKCHYVIDINSNKQNKFVPLTGQQIVSPEILKKEKIKKIIVMNPVYEKEIKILARKYNYKGRFILM
jgi:SAM-dependent methyltransferase